MTSVASRAIVMTWDPGARIATIRFERETDAVGEDAVVLVRAIRGWIGTRGLQFALLGDGRGLRSLDAEYRATWSRFLREHKRDCVIAFYHMGPVVRVAAEMFRLGTGLRLRAFAEERDARAWLREMGIAA